MQSKARSVEEYIRELPTDRAHAIRTIRGVILKHLDSGFSEGMQYGMIGYFVPHSHYANGYHCDPKQPLPFAGLASQKGNISLYFMHLYANPKELKWFQDEYAKTDKKLNMGKSCIRFRGIEDVPLDLIGKVVSRITAEKYVELYEKSIRPDTASRSKGASASKSVTTSKSVTASKGASASKAASASKNRDALSKKVASKSIGKSPKSKAPMSSTKVSKAASAKGSVKTTSTAKVVKTRSIVKKGKSSGASSSDKPSAKSPVAKSPVAKSPVAKPTAAKIGAKRKPTR